MSCNVELPEGDQKKPTRILNGKRENWYLAVNPGSDLAFYFYYSSRGWIKRTEKSKSSELWIIEFGPIHKLGDWAKLPNYMTYVD